MLTGSWTDTAAQVPHAEDKVDPVADIDVITSELRIKDIESARDPRRLFARDL